MNTFQSQYNYQYICGNNSVRIALSDRYSCHLQSSYENRYRWKIVCLFTYHIYWCMKFFMIISTYNTYNYLLFNSTHYADVWRYRASYRQVCCAGYRGPDCQRAYFAYLKLKGRRLTIDKKQKIEFLLLYRYNPEIFKHYIFHTYTTIYVSC